MKNKFADMNRQAQEQMKQQQGFDGSSSPKTPPRKPAGDYIDFEEIK